MEIVQHLCTWLIDYFNWCHTTPSIPPFSVFRAHCFLNRHLSLYTSRKKFHWGIYARGHAWIVAPKCIVQYTSIEEESWCSSNPRQGLASLVPRVLTSSHEGAPALRTSHTRDGQAKNVLLKKWGFETLSAPSQTGLSLGSPKHSEHRCRSKREAMRELFPDRRRRSGSTFVSETSPRPWACFECLGLALSSKISHDVDVDTKFVCVCLGAYLSIMCVVTAAPVLGFWRPLTNTLWRPP